ncbi:MAG: protein-S-isoprenylcysteine O-methyltransferase Ste14 [Crocinitomicaceae bacterium]|jgi:protein-S-isoprenylcysteine O-methyltransferase Ste14
MTEFKKETFLQRVIPNISIALFALSGYCLLEYFKAKEETDISPSFEIFGLVCALLTLLSFYLWYWAFRNSNSTTKSSTQISKKEKIKMFFKSWIFRGISILPVLIILFLFYMWIIKPQNNTITENKKNYDTEIETLKEELNLCKDSLELCAENGTETEEADTTQGGDTIYPPPPPPLCLECNKIEKYIETNYSYLFLGVYSDGEGFLDQTVEGKDGVALDIEKLPKMVYIKKSVSPQFNKNGGLRIKTTGSSGSVNSMLYGGTISIRPEDAILEPISEKKYEVWVKFNNLEIEKL